MKRRPISLAAYPCSSENEDDEQSGAREDEESNKADPSNTLSPTRRQPKRQVTPQCYSSLLESDSTDTEAPSEDAGKEQSISLPVNQPNGMTL